MKKVTPQTSEKNGKYVSNEVLIPPPGEQFVTSSI
jgi:hypothetical protein